LGDIVGGVEMKRIFGNLKCGNEEDVWGLEVWKLLVKA
jgi:hypothetical protein